MKIPKVYIWIISVTAVIFMIGVMLNSPIIQKDAIDIGYYVLIGVFSWRFSVGIKKDKITAFVNWLKENWFKVMAILLLLGGLYRYGLMPMQIKKECAKLATESYIVVGAMYIPVDDRLGGDRNNKNFNSYYERCLKEQGL